MLEDILQNCFLCVHVLVKDILQPLLNMGVEGVVLLLLHEGLHEGAVLLRQLPHRREAPPLRPASPRARALPQEY